MPQKPINWLRLSGVFFLILVALGLRFYRFEFPNTPALLALHEQLLPPGLHWDEAYNVLAALRLRQTGVFEPFIQIDLGKMPLHIDLTALIFYFTGPLTVGGRFASQLSGLLLLLTIGPLTHAATAQVLTETERDFLAWFATAQVAVTYWFVHFSRLGMEHITLATCSTLALLTLWQALNSASLWRFALAGGVLGGAIYTYPAAYALPVAVGGLIAHYAVFERPQWRSFLRSLAVYSLAFGLVILPLVIFAVRHSEWIFMRPAVVQATSITMIANNALNTLGGLLWRGDANTSYNFPGRPFFDVLQAAFFVVGSGVCLINFKRTAYAFVLIWLGVMLLPQVLSEAPHFGRIVGATVPAVWIAALGGMTIGRRLFKTPPAWAAFLGYLTVTTLFSAALTARDYFTRWPQVSDFERTFRVAERIEAELSTQLSGHRYISPGDGEIPTLRFMLNDQPERFVRFFNGRECLVLPPSHTESHFFLTAYEDKNSAVRLQTFYADPLNLTTFHADTLALVTQIDIPASAQRAIPTGHRPLSAWQLGGVMQPIAIHSPVTLPITTTTLSVTFTWEMLGASAEDLMLGLYLLGPDFPDGDFKLVGQADAPPCQGAYPSSRWVAGEWLSETRVLPLAENLLSGTYTLALALYNYPNLERVPVTDPNGTPAGDLAPIMSIYIEP